MRNSTNLSGATARVFEDTDTRCEDAAGNAYECALQALRDVRHMLPSEGVAVVDAVLDGACFEEEGQEFAVSFALPPSPGEAEALDSAQEHELFENTLMN